MGGRVRRLAAHLATVQGLDLWTTWQGIAAGAREMNHFGAVLLEHGFLAMVAAKVAGTGLILWLAVWLWHRQSQRLAQLALRGCCVAMWIVVAWNSGVVLLLH